MPTTCAAKLHAQATSGTSTKYSSNSMDDYITSGVPLIKTVMCDG